MMDNRDGYVVEEAGVGTAEIAVTLDRLAAAATLIEQTLHRLAEKQNVITESAEACIGRVVATVEAKRELELEQKLAAAEAEIAGLRAMAASATAGGRISGRKTMPAAMASLLAKQGVTVDSIEAGTLDAALTSLSIEQRIAVKAQLMRAGLLD